MICRSTAPWLEGLTEDPKAYIGGKIKLRWHLLVMDPPWFDVSSPWTLMRALSAHHTMLRCSSLPSIPQSDIATKTSFATARLSQALALRCFCLQKSTHPQPSLTFLRLFEWHCPRSPWTAPQDFSGACSAILLFEIVNDLSTLEHAHPCKQPHITRFSACKAQVVRCYPREIVKNIRTLEHDHACRLSHVSQHMLLNEDTSTHKTAPHKFIDTTLKNK